MLRRPLVIDGNRQIQRGSVRGPTACVGLPPFGGPGGAWQSRIRVGRAWDSRAAVRGIAGRLVRGTCAWDSRAACAWDSRAAVRGPCGVGRAWDSRAAVRGIAGRLVRGTCAWDSRAACAWDSRAAVRGPCD